MAAINHNSIERLYEDCTDAIDNERARQIGGAIIDRYNDLLNDFKDDLKGNDNIQSIEEVERTGAGLVPNAPPRPRMDDLQRVKYGLESLADALGIELRGQSGGTVQPAQQPEQQVVVNNNNIVGQSQEQSQEQSQSQSITLEKVREDVDTLDIPDEKRQHLHQLIDEFESEVESRNPDENTVSGIIDTAKNISAGVGTKLLYLAIDNGLTSVVQ